MAIRANLQILAKVFNSIRNPLPLMLDRLGITERPYLLRLKNGLAFELRPGRGDRYGFYEVLIKGNYTGNGQRIMPGDTVIDVGANIGCFALLAGSLVGPAGRVIALEPEQSAFAQLQRNIQLNGITNITARRVALGGREGAVKLHTGAVSLFNSIYDSVDEKATGDEFQEVPMTTFERIMADEGISRCDYLKIDCEGAEYDIMDALTPEIGSRINQVTMEMHHVPGRNTKEIIQKLGEFGFTMTIHNELFHFRRQAR